MHNQSRDNDFSLRELFETISDYLSYLWHKKIIILVAGLAAASLLTAVHLNDPPDYSAKLTFMLNEDAGNSFSGLSNILGQFGIGFGQSDTNLDKIIELSRSRTIAGEAFMDSVSVNNKEDLLANHLIDYLEGENKWERDGLFSFAGKKISLEGFRFEHSRTDSFSLRENKALKRLHTLLIGAEDEEPLMRSSFHELTGIMDLEVTTSVEDLSIITVNKLFEKLGGFYIEKSTEKQEYEFKIIKTKYDSIADRLGTVQYRLAEFQDSYQNLVRKQDALLEKKLKTEEQKLLIMSGEAEKQLQLASLALDNRTPYIQVIDAPIAPIKPSNRTIPYYFLVGGFTGVLVSTLILIGRKAITDILNS